MFLSDMWRSSTVQQITIITQLTTFQLTTPLHNYGNIYMHISTSSFYKAEEMYTIKITRLLALSVEPLDEGSKTVCNTFSLDWWDVWKREALVSFVSIIGDSCVVEARDEHHNAQNHEEDSCSNKKEGRGSGMEEVQLQASVQGQPSKMDLS